MVVGVTLRAGFLISENAIVGCHCLSNTRLQDYLIFFKWVYFRRVERVTLSYANYVFILEIIYTTCMM